MSLYRHVIEYAFRHVWAMERETLRTMVAVLSLRVQGDRISDEEIEARLAAARQGQGERKGRQTGATAVIPIYGMIMPKASLMTEMSGATSVDQLRADFRAALADEDVSRIVFDVDSPGGSVEGIPELAQEIRAARGTKPMTAVANYLMASGAYYLGSQADEVVASPSAMVGSIGVYSIHEDWAGAYEQAGISPSLIKAGKFKAEWADLGPLTDDARAHMQESVDDSYEMFVADVAKGRGTSTGKVREGYGEGRALVASKAKAEGLIDRVGTLDSVLASRPPAMRGSRAAEVTVTPKVSVSVTTSVTHRDEESADPFVALGEAAETTTDAILAVAERVEPNAYEFERERRTRQGLRPV